MMFSKILSYLLTALALLLLYSTNVLALDRCMKYYPIVKRHAVYYFSLNAPVHYFMGQMEQESRCNEGITAFDGGQGLYQLMPNTEREIEKDWMQQFNPYDPYWNIKAGIYYNWKMTKAVLCKSWYFVFRAYNGGAGRLNKEIVKAGCCDIQKVEDSCARGGVWYKGKYINFCYVNINYPYRIFERSGKYVDISY